MLVTEVRTLYEDDPAGDGNTCVLQFENHTVKCLQILHGGPENNVGVTIPVETDAHKVAFIDWIMETKLAPFLRQDCRISVTDMQAPVVGIPVAQIREQ